MADDFNVDNAVAVSDSPQGSSPVSTNFNVDNAVPVDASEHGQTPYDSFKQASSAQTTQDPTQTKQTTEVANKTPLNANKGQPDKALDPKEHGTVQGPTGYPDEGLLNGFIHSTEGAAWNMIAKPILGMKDPDVDKYLSDIEKQHPIAATIAGTAPYIATAPFFPEGLVGVSANFGAVSGLTALGKSRTEDALKPLSGKILDVAEETAKGASFGPIWHYSAPLGWVGKALTRGTGTTTLSSIYGNNIVESFKQGGVVTALSLIFENPALANTALGRGVIAKTNKDVYESMFGGELSSRVAQTSKPVKIDINSDPGTIKKGILDAVNIMTKRIFPGPNIASATVKLPDGIQIHGTSHDDALEKIGLTQKDGKTTEGKDYIAGFTVIDPNGKTRFITREESKQEPFNLPTGHSEDVPGLNESKFAPVPEPLKIVNPETLKGLNEEGKFDVNLIPGAAEAAEILDRSGKELKERFRAPAIGEEAKYTAQVLRAQLGDMARANDQLEVAHREVKKFFDKADQKSIIDTYTRAERGEKQDTPELQKIYDNLQQELRDEADKVRALGTGKLEEAIENYLPHAWVDPKKAGKILAQIFGKRPFEGPKSFLKKRTINDFAEGIEAGLEPVSWNPADLTMLKIREMRKYVMAQNTKAALKSQGLRKFVRIGGEVPDGWVKIKDNAEEVRSINDSGEMVVRGTYYTQPDAARIIDNYLSPGLQGKSYIYDMYRGAGNTLNQFQLGISAFHLGFTSMDATISKFALGLNKLSSGDFAGGIKELGKAPFAPITNIMQGRELLQAWYGKDMGSLTNTIAELMAAGGGRAKMDKFYATGAKDSMQKALKEGKIVTASMKVPFYIIEQMARPIMEYIVPRQKMGVFMDMMKMEMERNPGISHQELRGIAQRAWDSVDNRMGQVVYDNLFWDRTTKDLAMASVRSLGWNLGTIRELGGGVKDVFGNVDDVIHGRGTKMSYRTAYVMALPIVTGLYGAIYQYLHTGKGPQELKDYYFPKNGAIDNKGQEARVSLPTYMKDIYHYKTDPVQTVINKFSPVNNAVMEMITNKDFYGTQIRNMDDPAIQQILDESKFMASQFLPFGFRNLGKDTRTSSGSKIEPFIGITPAPYDINMTAAEKEAYELEKGKIPVGSRTKEQAKHSQAKSKLRSAYMASKDPEPLTAAVDEGVISAKEKRQLVKEAGMSNLQRMTQHLTFEEVEHIMKKANENEKPELQKILDKKRAGKRKSGTWTSDEEDMYAKSFDSKE